MTGLVILLIVGFIAWRIMPPRGVRSISGETLKPMLKDKTKQFIDVRTAGEYKKRHIKEFTHMPLNLLPGELSNLDKTKETIVICQSGMRSMQAAKVLKKAGFTDIINVSGGMSAWRD